MFILSSTGLDQLKAEVYMDHGNSPINKLCTHEKNNIEFHSLWSAFPIDDTAYKFDIMFREFSTDIFHTIWKIHMRKAGSGAQELSIIHIKTKIWDPTFNECHRLLESLYNRSIKFTDVDKYFLQVKEKEMQLHRLHSGVMVCLGKQEQKSAQNWIPITIKLMEEYWSLKKLAHAARTVMTLKEKLRLSGDFSLIQTIAEKKVRILKHGYLKAYFC